MELCIMEHQTLLKNKKRQAWENKGGQDKEAKRGQAWESIKRQDRGQEDTGHRTKETGQKTDKEDRTITRK